MKPPRHGVKLAQTVCFVKMCSENSTVFPHGSSKIWQMVLGEIYIAITRRNRSRPAHDLLFRSLLGAISSISPDHFFAQNAICNATGDILARLSVWVKSLLRPQHPFSCSGIPPHHHRRVFGSQRRSGSPGAIFALAHIDHFILATIL